MRKLVLLQRLEGRLTDVGPGLLAVELELKGEAIGLGDLEVSSPSGSRHGTALAVIFVMEEE